MSPPTPTPISRSASTQADWIQNVLFDRGYLSKIRGEAIKVYLVMIEACGGLPGQSVTISLSQLTARTQLSHPTVMESLTRLEQLGLVVSTTRQRGRVTSYYIPDPPPVPPSASSSVASALDT
jgi:DNA-binding transcriptional ArsR family regulator